MVGILTPLLIVQFPNTEQPDRQWKVQFLAGGDGLEGALHAGAERGDGADDDGGDECGDEAVFKSGGAFVVTDQGHELVQHGVLPD